MHKIIAIPFLKVRLDFDTERSKNDKNSRKKFNGVLHE